ncbi:DUF2000 family protein [Streptacidiphilus sp. P02-A3a]|uniref:DUF2000 family protein n=1 Tax=Streptacidiphilus sp. P02-A3a TaxID=2704468 RepID=UPI001CDB57E6|nr:DUF2000 family protein [Streptacidiphilus sp. P02-A3a]
MSTPRLSSEDIRTDLSTRKAKLKWVIVVDETVAAGRLVNAAACMAATVGKTPPDLVGREGEDASGGAHPGLPWAGCSVLAAEAGTLHALRAEAVAEGDELLRDQPRRPARQGRQAGPQAPAAPLTHAAVTPAATPALTSLLS